MPTQLRRITAAVFFALVSLGLVGPIAHASAQDATATPVATDTTQAEATATPEATTPMATATPEATTEATPAATTEATPAATMAATAAPTATPTQALAQTGSETTSLAMLGIVLVGSGLAAVSLSRRAN